MIGWMRVSAATGSWQWILSYGTSNTSQSMFIGFNSSITTVYFGGYGNDVTYTKPSGDWIGQWVMMDEFPTSAITTKCFQQMKWHRTSTRLEVATAYSG